MVLVACLALLGAACVAGCDDDTNPSARDSGAGGGGGVAGGGGTVGGGGGTHEDGGSHDAG